MAADLNEAVSVLVHAVTTAVEKELAPHGVTLIEYGVLRRCAREECTATQLAELLPVDGSRVSRIVTRLADEGLLRRRRLRSDRRVVMLRPSDDGLALTARIGEALGRYNATVTRGVGEDDMRVFLDVISRIVANHAALESPG